MVKFLVIKSPSAYAMQLQTAIGIDRGMPDRWVKEFPDDESEAFRGNGKPTAAGEELWRLREENRRLKMERDVLKKRRLSSRNHHSSAGT